MEIQLLADALIASCDGGESYTEDIKALTLEECKVLDGMALECAVVPSMVRRKRNEG
jgi:hypothetical protein